MSELTDRQREILRYLCRFFTEKHRAPTLRELMAHVGLASTNSANDHIRALEKKGFVMRDGSKHHGLRVLRDPDGRRPRLVWEFFGAGQ